MSTVQPTASGTPVAAATPTTNTATVSTAEKKEKKGKITERIVQELKSLAADQTMTIADLCEKIPDVKHSILQSTLSQLVKAQRVQKVTTGKRKPGYKAP